MKKIITIVVSIVFLLSVTVASARTQVLPLAVQEPVDFVTQQVWAAITTLQDQVNQFGSNTMQNNGRITILENRLDYLESLLDLAPPIISNIAASEITTSTAVIGWDTNENGANSMRYGTSTLSYPFTEIASSDMLHHNVLLEDLSKDTTYYYVIESEDYDGNLSISAEQNFTTSFIPEILWDKTFGGTESDSMLSVQKTTDSGYIITGYTASYGAGGIDGWLIKTDSAGNEEWNKKFGGSNEDIFKSSQQTTDGGYIIAGYTASYGAGAADMWLIKTDSAGIEEWSKTFGGVGNDFGYSVQQTTDGGYIITGHTESYGVGAADIYLVKTDSAGIEEWSKTFGGVGNDSSRSLKQTTDGGYIIAGYTYSYGDGSRDGWLIKTDSTGIEEWNKKFGDSGSDSFESIQQTTDGGYIMTGYTTSYDVLGRDMWLVKADSAGIEEWNKTFGGFEGDDGKTVQQTTDGGYLALGSYAVPPTGEFDIYLVKADSAGNEEWSKTFGGNQTEYGHSIQEVSDNEYIIGGNTLSYGAGSYDFWIIKTN
jgi:hypothetical protein